MKHPSLNNRDRISQKIEMPFPDYEIGVNMPTKRNMKNYTLVEVIQPKNYYEIVKAKLCHNVEEIVLSYVFYDSKRQTHACKLNLNYDMADLYWKYMIVYPTSDHRRNFYSLEEMLRINHIEWSQFMFGQKAECSFCRKKFLNFQDKTKHYNAESLRMRKRAGNWRWAGKICNKCDKRYNIETLFECEHEDIIVSFMCMMDEGETQDERNEIDYNWHMYATRRG